MFRKSRLMTQFYAVLAIVSVILILAGIGANQNFEPIVNDWNYYENSVTKRQSLLMNIKAEFGYGSAIHNFKNYVLRGSDKYLSKLDNNFSKLLSLLDEYRGLPELTNEEKQALTKIQSVAKQYQSQVPVVEKMVKQGATPVEIDSVVKINDSPALEGFIVLDNAYTHLTGEIRGAISEHTSNAHVLVFWGTLITITLIWTLILLMGRSIIKGITTVRSALVEAEKSNDVRFRLSEDGASEIADLCTSYNSLMERFNHIITLVAKSAATVGIAIVKQNHKIDQTVTGVRTQHQEIDQIATAMEEMSATVQDVARNTNMAADSAQNAKTEADSGSQAMAQTITAIDTLRSRIEAASKVIGRLENESNEVSKVVEVISSISEQTNLLALNAAIEAARAGEHGRGFAVVADEVRALAAKTKGSTDEINQMIERLQSEARQAVAVMEESQTETVETSGRIEKAGGALNIIVNEIGVISDMTSQIATAVNQQSSVTEEMSRNIANINVEANNTTQLAEQTLEDTNLISDKVDELRTHTSSFQIEDLSVQLEQAKAAHMAWRIQLREFLNGHGHLNKEQAVSHKDCSLGQWYYSKGLQEFGNLQEMRALEGPHAEIHRLIRHIVDLKESGKIDAAEAEYEKIGPLSQKIVDLIGELENRILSRTQSAA
ncbi:MAG: methyl-accepting chemotaxis protein [Chromatiales bacterium]|nr:methyl-accepting chemotaxis protein [Chromatiales bacterium]